MDLKNIRVIPEIIDSQNSSLDSDEVKYIQNLYGEDFIKEKKINHILDDLIEEKIEEIVKETIEEQYVTNTDESDNNRFTMCCYYILHILSPIKNYKRLMNFCKKRSISS